jgi:origin recognition complex subunit 1
MTRSKNWLTKGGFSREDSDDELGDEDIPWEWVYEEASARTEDEQKPSKKRKASAMADTPKPIVGAQIGSFSVKVGDAVLLKSPEQGKDWAGLICAFSEIDDDGEEDMCCHIQWFCSAEELMGGKRSKIRDDVLPNESYITADFNLNPLTAINGKATVLSKDEFFKKYPEGKLPRSKAAQAKYSKTVICRRGVKQRTVQYTEEFDWDEKYTGPADLLKLVDWIKDQTKGKSKSSQVERHDHEYVHKKHIDEPTTPRKKQKTVSMSHTPRSSAKTSKYLTPTHKRVTIKAPLEITPLGTRLLSPSQFLSSPYAHARTTLHVSAVPSSLPCRTNEFTTVYNHLHSAITEGTGTCIYISGTPGTGKTATVREVVSTLHSSVLSDDLEPFHFVEINGLKLSEPHQSYSLLWEALKGDRVAPNHALSLLEHEFTHPSPRRVPCVVLMDELDQLVTKTQSVMYNFFNWPALRHSKLIVLAVANTMDLPERTLSNKISSRLGLTRITFPGYTHSQLMEIITARLEGVPGGIVEKDAVQFAARKVAAVSGDARRALDICRRAVEIAEQSQERKEIEEEPNEAATPSKTGRNKQKDGIDPSLKKLARVTIATIKQAIREATTSPVAQHLRSLPLSAKLFLAALLARSRRTGVAESTLSDVLIEAKRIADVSGSNAIKNFLLMDASKSKVPRVLAIGAAAMGLVEAGIIAMETRARGERAGKVRLRIGDDEVKGALLNDDEAKGLGLQG